jgi:hypothetical protein
VGRFPIWSDTCWLRAGRTYQRQPPLLMPNQPIYFVSFPPLSKKSWHFSHTLSPSLLEVLPFWWCSVRWFFFEVSTSATFLVSGKSTSSPFFRFLFLFCTSSILVFPSCWSGSKKKGVFFYFYSGRSRGEVECCVACRTVVWGF